MQRAKNHRSPLVEIFWVVLFAQDGQSSAECGCGLASFLFEGSRLPKLVRVASLFSSAKGAAARHESVYRNHWLFA